MRFHFGSRPQGTGGAAEKGPALGFLRRDSPADPSLRGFPRTCKIFRIFFPARESTLATLQDAFNHAKVIGPFFCFPVPVHRHSRSNRRPDQQRNPRVRPEPLRDRLCVLARIHNNKHHTDNHPSRWRPSAQENGEYRAPGDRSRPRLGQRSAGTLTNSFGRFITNHAARGIVSTEKPEQKCIPFRRGMQSNPVKACNGFGLSQLAPISGLAQRWKYIQYKQNPDLQNIPRNKCVNQTFA